MASDIVERLEIAAQHDTPHDTLMNEAAAEIERLRAEVQTRQGHARTAIWSDSAECKMLAADNERLRAALQHISNLSPTEPHKMQIKARAALAEEKKG